MRSLAFPPLPGGRWVETGCPGLDGSPGTFRWIPDTSTRGRRVPVLPAKRVLAIARGVGYVYRGVAGLGAVSGVLTVQQVYNLARGAGFPSDVARQMVAIAQRESGLKPSARCLDCLKDSNGNVIREDSIGLWQINMNPSWAAQRRALFGISSNDALLDPATNAAAAYKLWGGSAANLASVWAIDRDGTFPWRTRYLGFLNALPSASALELGYAGGGSGSGDGVACAQVLKTCPDGSSVGYVPGTCEYKPCPTYAGGDCGYCRADDWICRAGCELLGPVAPPPADVSANSGGTTPADQQAGESRLQMAVLAGVGLALVWGLVTD